MDLNGQVVTIIGGGGGIGRAGALALAQAGCALVVADVNEQAAQQTAAAIQAAGGRAIALRCDASDDDQVTQLAAHAITAFGRVDILWSHAGITLAGPPERIPLPRWRELWDVNVLGAVRAVQAFLPAMLERRSGHLIFTSSGLGLFPEDIPGFAAPYVITKAAQIALGRTLAPYLAPQGVGVSVLIPDLTATQHAFAVPTIELDPAVVAANLDPTAMQQPEQVAALLVTGLQTDTFLISAVPHTAERLVAAAAQLYAATPSPASTNAAVHDDSAVIQTVHLVADGDRHDELAELLSLSAKEIAQEPGAVTYQVSVDPQQRGVFHIFEEWGSAAALEGHSARPESHAMLARMGEFGIDSLQVRRYSVSNIDQSTVAGASS